MLPLLHSRSRIARSVCILTFLATASAQQVDERMRAAPHLEPAPWAEPEGASRPATIRDPALLRQALAEIQYPIFDDVGDGAVWVLGQNYKARIDAGGLTFVPFLGARAPRNFPVSLSLASATIGAQELPLHFQAQPVRDGARIWVDHGSITEVFDVAEDSIEQSFVVHRGAALGDLDVRLDVETDLRQTMNGLGTWFTTSAGGVHYGLATTLDADGSELVTTSLPVDRAVEFVVSADEVARAVGDLTIDPIVATVNLASTSLDDRDPDVAYDVSNDRYIVVFERVYSANDHDIFCQMVDGATGQPIANTWSYIDFTWENWCQPSVANMNSMDQFLVAAAVGQNAKVIKCRTRFAGSTSMGTPFALSDNAPGSICPSYINEYTSNLAPVVGGDSWPGSGLSYYCVAWSRNRVRAFTYTSVQVCSDLLYCMVTSNGVAGPPRYVENMNAIGVFPSFDGSQVSLAISKSDGDPYSGASQDWNLAYWNTQSGVQTLRIHWNGNLWGLSIPVLTASNPLPGGSSYWDLYSRVSVSSSVSNSSRKYLVTWDSASVSGLPRLYSVVVDPVSSWGMTPPGVAYDLTALQQQISGVQYSGQWQPSVDCDGTNFVVAFNAFQDGANAMAAAEFGEVTVYKKFITSTVLRCFEPQLKIENNIMGMGRSRACAECSGGGSRRNVLIGYTNWGGASGGDPLAALHTH